MKTIPTPKPLTPRAKKVLALADRVATEHNHSYIGVEHIVLGLCREGERLAEMLKSIGTDFQTFKEYMTKAFANVTNPPDNPLICDMCGKPATKNVTCVRSDKTRIIDFCPACYEVLGHIVDLPSQ